MGLKAIFYIKDTKISERLHLHPSTEGCRSISISFRASGKWHKGGRNPHTVKPTGRIMQCSVADGVDALKPKAETLASETPKPSNLYLSPHRLQSCSTINSAQQFGPLLLPNKQYRREPPNLRCLDRCYWCQPAGEASPLGVRVSFRAGCASWRPLLLPNGPGGCAGSVVSHAAAVWPGRPLT